MPLLCSGVQHSGISATAPPLQFSFNGISSEGLTVSNTYLPTFPHLNGSHQIPELKAEWELHDGLCWCLQQLSSLHWPTWQCLGLVIGYSGAELWEEREKITCMRWDWILLSLPSTYTGCPPLVFDIYLLYCTLYFVLDVTWLHLQSIYHSRSFSQWSHVSYTVYLHVLYVYQSRFGGHSRQTYFSVSLCIAIDLIQLLFEMLPHYPKILWISKASDRRVALWGNCSQEKYHQKEEKSYLGTRAKWQVHFKHGRSRQFCVLLVALAALSGNWHYNFIILLRMGLASFTLECVVNLFCRYGGGQPSSELCYQHRQWRQLIITHSGGISASQWVQAFLCRQLLYLCKKSK